MSRRPTFPSPILWGVDEVARQRLAGAREIRTEKRLYSRWMYPFPVEDVVDFFGAHFGPIVRANAALDADERVRLRTDLIDVFRRFNRGASGETRIEGEFLSVEAVR